MTTPGDDDRPDLEEEEDEPSGGSIAASDELEEALRQATESVEAHEAARKGGGAGAGRVASADKVLLEAMSEELQAGKELYEAVVKERDELQDRFLRLQAEFENFRRRGLKERQETHNYGHQNVVKDLLPTVDNLDRAIAHSAEAAEGSGGADLQALVQGIELVRRELLGVLGNHGVTRVEAAGQPFDPAHHEAMSQVVDESVPPGTVIEVLEEGYQLRDRLLRPARVVVSRHADSTAGAGAAPGAASEPDESR